MRLHASACASFHSPVSWSEMRPSGLTAVASATMSPAPPAAIAAEVHEMPVVRHAVAGVDRVLAERRHPDAVADREVADRDGGEEPAGPSGVASSTRGDGLGRRSCGEPPQPGLERRGIGEHVAVSADGARALDVLGLVVDEQQVGGGDAELGDRVLVDLGSGLTSPSSPLMNTRSKSGANEPWRSQPRSRARRSRAARGACRRRRARAARAACRDRPRASCDGRWPTARARRRRSSRRRPRPRRPASTRRSTSCRGRVPRDAPSTPPRTARRRRRPGRRAGRGRRRRGARDDLAVVEDDDARGEADRGEGCRRHPPQPIVGT